MVYKDVQKKADPPLRPKIYTPPAQIKTTYIQPGITYAQITKQNSYPPPQTQRKNHTPTNPFSAIHTISNNKAVTIN
jgi:hypothetical protein